MQISHDKSKNLKKSGTIFAKILNSKFKSNFSKGHLVQMTQLLFVINNIGSFSSASSCCSWFYRIPKREKFPSVQQLHIYMHPISRKNSKVDPYGRRRAAWVFDSISHFTIRSHIMDFKQFYKQRKKLSHVFRIKCLRFVRVCRHVYIFHFFNVSVWRLFPRNSDLWSRSGIDAV